MLTYSEIGKNKRATALLMGIFLIVIIGFGYVFSQAYGRSDILFFAVLFSVGSAWFSYFFSDKVALASVGAREITRDDSADLYRLVENIAITAGLPMPRVYVMDDPAPNAFATGRDPKHAALCFTTGILATLERSELEGVVAHEMSHVGNRDILYMTIAVTLAGALSLLSDWFLRAGMFGFGRRDDREGQQGPWMVLGIVLAILAPLAGLLVRLAISRKREFLADATGALITRYPEGLARALEKISKYTKPIVAAGPATAHLFIANPLGSGKTARWFSGLFNTHPPIEERISRLLNMGNVRT